MKKYLTIIGVALVIIFVIAGIYKGSTKNKLNSLESDVDEQPAFCIYDTFYFDNAKVELSNISELKGKDVLQVVVKTGDLIYLVYQDPYDNEKRWFIGKINICSNSFECVFSDVFCDSNGSDYNFTLCLNGKYSERNCAYFDNRIIITDHKKLAEYNLLTNTVNLYSFNDYVFPECAVNGEVRDHGTIQLSYGTNCKTFGIDEIKDDSASLQRLVSLGNSKIWDGGTRTDSLFDNIQIVDNTPYIICRVLNYLGESYAVVLSYDFNSDLFSYVSAQYIGDVVQDHYYIVPQSQCS